MDTAADEVMADETRQKAPRYQIPSTNIDVIEHPCIIKNVDKCIKSLGGAYRLNTVRIRLFDLGFN